MNDLVPATVLVDTLGFRVPCRSFHLRVNVTRDRPLPVVDEFVLRLLRMCGQLTIRRLGDFFGFTVAEAERVVRDLIQKDLLVAEGDDIRLSANAAALFRASADEKPRLMEVEPWTENVWIDLISRSFVPRPRSRPLRNLMDVPAATDAKDIPVEFARSAFEENFREYVRSVRRLREPERVSIHSIVGVEPDRHGSVVITARKTVTPGEKGSRLEFDGFVDATRQERTMARTLSAQYAELAQPRAQLTSVADFERLIGIQLSTFFDEDHEFDLPQWFRTRPPVGERGFEWVVGASYLGDNVRALVERVEKKKPEQVKPEIRWLRPGGNVWGMTADLGDAIVLLRRAVALPETPRASGLR
jgi:hypothetical protein